MGLFRCSAVHTVVPQIGCVALLFIRTLEKYPSRGAQVVLQIKRWHLLHLLVNSEKSIRSPKSITTSKAASLNLAPQPTVASLPTRGIKCRTIYVGSVNMSTFTRKKRFSRPKVHFCAHSWINDPCAPYYDAKTKTYHLFYQC